MPNGFQTLDGFHPEYRDLYGMQETESPDWVERTEKNAAAAYLTLFIGPNHCSPGAKATRKAVLSHDFHSISFISWPAQDLDYLTWYIANTLKYHKVVNIAGNRDKWLEQPVEAWLTAVFLEVQRQENEATG